MAASDRPFALWIRSHADVVRFAGPIVAVVLLFFVGLSWVSVIVLGALVVLYELGMRWLAEAVPTPPRHLRCSLRAVGIVGSFRGSDRR